MAVRSFWARKLSTTIRAERASILRGEGREGGRGIENVGRREGGKEGGREGGDVPCIEPLLLEEEGGEAEEGETAQGVGGAQRPSLGKPNLSE